MVTKTKLSATTASQGYSAVSGWCVQRQVVYQITEMHKFLLEMNKTVPRWIRAMRGAYLTTPTSIRGATSPVALATARITPGNNRRHCCRKENPRRQFQSASHPMRNSPHAETPAASATPSFYRYYHRRQKSKRARVIAAHKIPGVPKVAPGQGIRKKNNFVNPTSDPIDKKNPSPKYSVNDGGHAGQVMNSLF